MGVTDCPHTNREPVWTSVNTYLEPMQSRRLREQCQDCGALLAGDLAHKLAGPNTREVDIDAARKAMEAGEQKWVERDEERQREREREREQRRADYNAYLSTAEWWRRRSLVMDRANEICEG